MSSTNNQVQLLPGHILIFRRAQVDKKAQNVDSLKSRFNNAANLAAEQLHAESSRRWLWTDLSEGNRQMLKTYSDDKKGLGYMLLNRVLKTSPPTTAPGSITFAQLLKSKSSAGNKPHNLVYILSSDGKVNQGLFYQEVLRVLEIPAVKWKILSSTAVSAGQSNGTEEKLWDNITLTSVTLDGKDRHAIEDLSGNESVLAPAVGSSTELGNHGPRVTDVLKAAAEGQKMERKELVQTQKSTLYYLQAFRNTMGNLPLARHVVFAIHEGVSVASLISRWLQTYGEYELVENPDSLW